MDTSLQVPDAFNAAAFVVDENVSRLKNDKVAIYYQDHKISYKDLQREINKAGNGLKRLGIEIENRIAILLHDCPEWVACFFGCIKIGAVPVALNTMMVPQDYEYFLNDSRAKAIVVSDNLVQKIESIKGKLNYLKHMIVVGEAGKNHSTYQNLVNGASSELQAADTCKDDVAFWQYTSGSTGLPRVMHLH
jgi:benzoate-CoA ligase